MSTQDTTSSERRKSERIFKQQLIMYPNDEEDEKRMLLYALCTMIMETNHGMQKHIYVSRVIAISPFSTCGFNYRNTHVWGSERDNPYVATLKILVPSSY